MLYLGEASSPKGIKYCIRTDPKKLNSWPNPIALESRIGVKTLKGLLEILNGEGTFYIKECNKIKVAEGVGGSDIDSFWPIFGEIEKSLEHEAPFFRGPDGETRGHFSFYMVKPKSDLAILVKQTTIYSKYSKEPRREGKVYFLRKDSMKN